MQPELHRVAFWLVPAAPDRRLLAQIVARLAAEHGAPRFRPHVTLLGGCCREPVTVALCARVLAGAAEVSPMTLTVRRVRHSDDFFETVVLDLDDHDAVTSLRKRLSALFAAERIEASHRPFRPHVSLIYKRSSQAWRERIASALEGPATIACDALAAIVPGAAGWEDVSSWRVLVSQPLGQ